MISSGVDRGRLHSELMNILKTFSFLASTTIISIRSQDLPSLETSGRARYIL